MSKTKGEWKGENRNLLLIDFLEWDGSWMSSLAAVWGHSDASLWNTGSWQETWNDTEFGGKVEEGREVRRTGLIEHTGQ